MYIQRHASQSFSVNVTGASYVTEGDRETECQKNGPSVITEAQRSTGPRIQRQLYYVAILWFLLKQQEYIVIYEREHKSSTSVPPFKKLD